MVKSRIFQVLVLVWAAASCSTTPESNREQISTADARAFLAQYCSKVGGASLVTPIRGELLVRSSTREFKGQYPASVQISKNGELVLEVTNLIGGTVAMLKGDLNSLEVVSRLKPQFNRKNIRHYMGLSVPLLVQLLHGDLPCPSSTAIEADGTSIVLKDQSLIWKIERSDAKSGAVPLRLVILDGATVQVDMTIERWNSDQSYAEKVKVTTPEGDLKWTWRSRTSQD